ncbi:PREDICTED: B3 domain-containing protein Os01g0234100-like [Erythranthe guttata]|nr:PREDICTED: B3 domain-containing protein Os01g0234100-like [Erythranthe guttata]|eukprot:XP_012850825.1 PREDICTED: B3 domain-containing protein Os01g0234100-like [Erythranthe guttata]
MKVVVGGSDHKQIIALLCEDDEEDPKTTVACWRRTTPPPKSERKRTRDCDIYEDEEAKRSVMQRAAELLARLEKEYNLPSFVKCMLPSNVSQGFWLHLPKKFCKVNLPNEDTPVVLVDELGREHTTSYLLGRNGLSAGWRAFSMKHKLLKGDLLIFLLTEPCKFKAPKVRPNELKTEEHILVGVVSCINEITISTTADPDGCLNVNSSALDQAKGIQANSFEQFPSFLKQLLKSHLSGKFYLVYIVRAGKITENEGAIGLQTYDFENIKPISAAKMEDQMEENACTGKTARQLIDQFKDISGFEDFKIHLGGLILDSEIPKNIRAKYYNLCCSQRMFLLDHLINGLSTKLAVVMISETTNISEAVRSADVSTSLHHLECWEKTFKAFEDLGMAVGFIRNRLHKLLEISREAQSNNESKMIVRAQADHVSGNLETTSLNVEALIGSLEAEIETLRWKNEKLGFEFRELARAPWMSNWMKKLGMRKGKGPLIRPPADPVEETTAEREGRTHNRNATSSKRRGRGERTGAFIQPRMTIEEEEEETEAEPEQEMDAYMDPLEDRGVIG